MNVKTLHVRTGTHRSIFALAFPRENQSRDPCPTLAFLTEKLADTSYASDARSLARLLTDLSEGDVKNEQRFKYLKGTNDIWEMRAGALRLLAFTDNGALIICSHGFVKKSGKTPAKEKSRASDNRKRYFEAKTQGVLSNGRSSPKPKTDR